MLPRDRNCSVATRSPKTETLSLPTHASTICTKCTQHSDRVWFGSSISRRAQRKYQPRFWKPSKESIRGGGYEYMSDLIWDLPETCYGKNTGSQIVHIFRLGYRAPRTRVYNVSCTNPQDMFLWQKNVARLLKEIHLSSSNRQKNGEMFETGLHACRTRTRNTMRLGSTANDLLALQRL